MKRFLLLGLFFVLFVFSNAAQGTSKSLNQLSTQLAEAKSVAEELAVKIELIDFYARVDSRKCKTAINQLLSSRKRYPNDQSQQKIDLIFAEYLFNSGNTEQFKLLFSNKLSKQISC